jgi:hypothetical protein
MAEYSPPLDRLLTLGDPFTGRAEWEDYAALGITREHVPELIRMAVDPELNEYPDSDSPLVWAPIHAWRALGQLGAVEGIGPLLDYAQANEEREPDDWITEEMPHVFARMGPAAVPPLLAALEDTGRKDLPRLLALEGLEHLVEEHPEFREQVVSALVRILERAEENPQELNGFAIATLSEWEVREALPVMERAYQADLVDQMWSGTWDYVLFKMGLGPDPSEARENLFGPPPVFHPDYAPQRAPSGAHTPAERARERSKARRKGKKKRKK